MEAPVKVLDPLGRELQELVETRARLLPHSPPVRVLLPFDGSEASMHAVRYAAACLSGMPASVRLLNAQQPVLDDPALLHAAYAILEAHRRAGERILRPAEQVLREAQVPFESEVAMAPPVEAIVRASVRHSSTLVLMGTRGRNAVVNLLTGSVPTRVIQRSSVPVLLVRPHSPPPPVSPPSQFPSIAA